MKYFNILVLSLFFAVTAHADGKYSCTSDQGGVTDTLVVFGTGQQATVQITDPLFSGTATYNAQMTAALAQPQSPYSGLWAIVGNITDNLTNPPTVVQAAFLVDPALLSGSDGKFYRMSDDSFSILDCARQQ